MRKILYFYVLLSVTQRLITLIQYEVDKNINIDPNYEIDLL